MNSRQVALLAAVMLALVGLAAWVAISRTPELPETDALYPALKDQLGKINGIKIVKASDVTAIELERKGDEWIVKERNFAADNNKIASLLIALEGAQLREEKTSNPENYSRLGVEDLSASTASGAQVELTGLEQPIKVILGKQDPTTQFVFARRVGEKQSWLLTTSPVAPTETTYWLRRDLIDIGADRVQEVVTQPASGPRYTVIKNSRSDPNFDVTGIPKGREVNSVSATNTQAQTLSNLELDDARPIADLTSHKPAAQTSFRTFDGLVVDVEGYALENKHWIVLKPSFDAERAKKFHAAPTATTAVEPKTSDAKPTTESLDAVVAKGKSEADLAARKLHGWAFEVAAFKYDALFKPLEELLKKK